MDIPKWAHCYLDEKGVAQIQQAVQEVERKTSAELVPMVVRRSSAVGHVGLSLLLLFWLLFFVVRVDHYQFHYFGFGHWVWIVYVLVSFVFAGGLAQLPLVQRILVPNEDEKAQVMRRAQLEFCQSKIQQTAGATGVLFFISLMERRAVVLADKAIAEKLPPETWDKVVQTMISGIKKASVAQGMADAIHSAESLLVPLFPVASNDLNELANNLIIKE